MHRFFFHLSLFHSCCDLLCLTISDWFSYEESGVHGKRTKKKKSKESQHTPLCGWTGPIRPRLPVCPPQQNMLARWPRVIHHLLAADLHSSDQHSSATTAATTTAPSWNSCSHASSNDWVGQSPSSQPGHGGVTARPSHRRLSGFGGGCTSTRGQESLEVKARVTLPRWLEGRWSLCGL